jgi:hypothetical protein
MFSVSQQVYLFFYKESLFGKNVINFIIESYSLIEELLRIFELLVFFTVLINCNRILFLRAIGDGNSVLSLLLTTAND